MKCITENEAINREGVVYCMPTKTIAYTHHLQMQLTELETVYNNQTVTLQPIHYSPNYSKQSDRWRFTNFLKGSTRIFLLSVFLVICMNMLTISLILLSKWVDERFVQYCFNTAIPSLLTSQYRNPPRTNGDKLTLAPKLSLTVNHVITPISVQEGPTEICVHFDHSTMPA